MKGKLIDQKQNDAKSIRNLQKSWKETEAKKLGNMDYFLTLSERENETK